MPGFFQEGSTIGISPSSAQRMSLSINAAHNQKDEHGKTPEIVLSQCLSEKTQLTLTLFEISLWDRTRFLGKGQEIHVFSTRQEGACGCTCCPVLAVQRMLQLSASRAKTKQRLSCLSSICFLLFCGYYSNKHNHP